MTNTNETKPLEEIAKLVDTMEIKEIVCGRNFYKISDEQYSVEAYNRCFFPWSKTREISVYEKEESTLPIKYVLCNEALPLYEKIKNIVENEIKKQEKRIWGRMKK